MARCECTRHIFRVKLLHASVASTLVDIQSRECTLSTHTHTHSIRFFVQVFTSRCRLMLLFFYLILLFALLFVHEQRFALEVGTLNFIPFYVFANWTLYLFSYIVGATLCDAHGISKISVRVLRSGIAFFSSIAFLGQLFREQLSLFMYSCFAQRTTPQRTTFFFSGEGHQRIEELQLCIQFGWQFAVNNKSSLRVSNL